MTACYVDLAEITSMTDGQVCIRWNVDERWEIIDLIQSDLRRLEEEYELSEAAEERELAYYGLRGNYDPFNLCDPYCE